MKVPSTVFQNIYGNAETLAANDVKVPVGDFNMEVDLVKEALKPIQLEDSVTVSIFCPTGVRGDELGRAGTPRLAPRPPPIRDRPRP